MKERRAVLQSLPAKKRKEAVPKMAMSLIRGLSPVVYYMDDLINDMVKSLSFIITASKQSRERKHTRTRMDEHTHCRTQTQFKKQQLTGSHKFLSV